MAGDFFQRVVDRFAKRNNWSKSAQSQHYKNEFNVFQHQNNKYAKPNIPAASDMEDVTAVSAADFQLQTSQISNFIYSMESSKNGRLAMRREMAVFPEISFALGEIEDEAINYDEDGEVIEFQIKNPRLLQNENIVRNLNNEWNFIINDVMEIKKNINAWWNDYMIDGEIFFEKVVDPANSRERGILKVKRLRAEFTHPRWNPDIENEGIFDFIYKGPTNILLMPPSMVAYANSGLYDFPDRDTKIVKSFLDYARIDYRKLKQIEDALVIYRLTKSIERRIFKVEVGKLPKQKAEKYVQDMMKKYRQRKTYNPETGEASQSLDVQAMIEDFWLPQNDGKGSSIDTLSEGKNLGEIQDVEYFLNKLFRALRIPMSRMKQDTGFSLGDTSDISREEVRFHKMVQKFTNRFADVFTQIFLSHLRLKGYADEYGITEKDIVIKLKTNNLFEEFMETEIFAKRAETFERFIEYADSEEGKEPLFDKQWLMKRFLRLTPEEILENEEYLKKNKNKHFSGDGGGSSSSSSSGGGNSLSSLSDETSSSTESSPTEESNSDITGEEPKAQETKPTEKSALDELNSFAE